MIAKRERARKTMSIRIKFTTHRELARRAKRENRSVGNYVRTLLEKIVEVANG